MFVNYVGWCSAEKRCGKKLSMLGSYCVLRGNFFGQEGGGGLWCYFEVRLIGILFF